MTRGKTVLQQRIWTTPAITGPLAGPDSAALAHLIVLGEKSWQEV